VQIPFVDVEVQESPVYVSKLIERKRKRTRSLYYEALLLEELMEKMPDADSEFHIITDKGFSAIAFVQVVAKREIIESLTISTWAIGMKQVTAIASLMRSGRIQRTLVNVGTIMGKGAAGAAVNKAYEKFDTICEEAGINVVINRVHAKIILMKTATSWYVVETSANFNENMCREQFSIFNDCELYEFYRQALITKVGGG